MATYLGSNFTPVPPMAPAACDRNNTPPTLYGCGIVPGLAGWRVRRYWMRATDSTSAVTEWSAGTPDATGAESTNSNKPFTDVVIVGYL